MGQAALLAASLAPACVSCHHAGCVITCRIRGPAGAVLAAARIASDSLRHSPAAPRRHRHPGRRLGHQRPGTNKKGPSWAAGTTSRAARLPAVMNNGDDLRPGPPGHCRGSATRTGARGLVPRPLSRSLAAGADHATWVMPAHPVRHHARGRRTTRPSTSAREAGMTEFCDVAGGRIACEVTGSGPLVVLWHGIGVRRQDYRFPAPLPARAGYRVATADLRGHGEPSLGTPSPAGPPPSPRRPGRTWPPASSRSTRSPGSRRPAWAGCCGSAATAGAPS